jgi:hypothetical protein
MRMNSVLTSKKTHYFINVLILTTSRNIFILILSSKQNQKIIDSVSDVYSYESNSNGTLVTTDLSSFNNGVVVEETGDHPPFFLQLKQEAAVRRLSQGAVGISAVVVTYIALKQSRKKEEKRQLNSATTVFVLQKHS